MHGLSLGASVLRRIGNGLRLRFRVAKGRPRSIVPMAAGVLALTSLACHGLLDVSNPTLVRDDDVANAFGANARRVNAVGTLNSSMASIVEDVATITDEWNTDGPDFGHPINLLDDRDSEGYETSKNTQDAHLGYLDKIFWETSIAIPPVRAYTPDSLKGDFLGQLYAIRGFAVLQIAEDMCPGFPLNDVGTDSRPLFGGPLTTDSALAFASAQLDSAIKYARDSTTFITLARVAKGRLLLDQGKYTDAAAVVAPVQTVWIYQTTGRPNAINNDWSVGSWDQGGRNNAVGDYEGGNGLPFASAKDPRIPLVVGGTSARNDTDTLYKSTKYSQPGAQIVLASGVEARLIEAEVALHAGDPSWLTILNTLRGTAISPALPALQDPGTASTRVDLVYRERAFWMYLTGHRLGDMRRLIKNYSRNPETIFPTGDYSTGGSYGTATSIPFILAGQQLSNPHITTGCTAR